MTEPLYWVVIRTKKRRLGRHATRTVRRMGPMPRVRAETVKIVALTKLDRESFSVQITVDRTHYFAEYHKRRYGNDAAYRKKCIKRASAWNNRARASRRGDMTPWLTQD